MRPYSATARRRLTDREGARIMAKMPEQTMVVEYDRTGDVTKIRVTLWRDLADTDIRKGDIVEVDATLIEKEFPKQDGTTGRQLQTDFINSIVVKWRDPNAGAPVAPVAAEQSFAGFAGAPAGFL